jgi:O-antigen ligase
MALENPLGIGPLVFGQLFGEDTHDIWLKALLDYGWLGFASWAMLIGWTMAAGFRLLFRDRPWQPYLLCAYVVFVGHVFLGTIIDTDHWRHVYLLLGMVWGCIALEYRYQRGLLPGVAADPGRPLAPKPRTVASDAGSPRGVPSRAAFANRSLLGLARP